MKVYSLYNYRSNVVVKCMWNLNLNSEGLLSEYYIGLILQQMSCLYTKQMIYNNIHDIWSMILCDS